VELFDLNALTDLVRGQARFRKLAPAIRQASSMSMVKNDLTRAGEMLSACKALQQEALRDTERRREVTRSKAATIQALFAQAVLLYTRATHSSGAGRNKLQITGFLSPDLRAVHAAITRLRDGYLAHYGEPGAWERHRVVLALDLESEQMALSYPHESYYVRAEEAEELERLLKAARAIADQAYARASERLNLILNELFEEDPGLLDLLRASPFRPADFFGPEAVEGYLAGIGSLDPDPFTSPQVQVPSSRRPGRPADRKDRS
jgi:hypothetical protein